MSNFALSPRLGCFYERNVDLAIPRRAVSEAVGTLLLVLIPSAAFQSGSASTKVEEEVREPLNLICKEEEK